MQPDTQLPKPPTVGVYTALINQVGTNAPTATVLQNTIGNIIWSRFSLGTYRATLAGAFPYKKTTTGVTGIIGYYVDTPMQYSYGMGRYNDDIIEINVFLTEDGTPAEISTVFTSTPMLVEIKVYNNLQNSIS